MIVKLIICAIIMCLISIVTTNIEYKCNDQLIIIGDINSTICDETQHEFLVFKSPDEDCQPYCENRLVLYNDDRCGDDFKCAPGLKCNQTDYMCILDFESCLHYNFIKPEYYFKNTLLWKPKCLIDGTYAPVQCKGEQLNGRCFCTDKYGKRIFGESWWSQADNMTCACSRERAELIEQGRFDVSLHCDALGNYEPLQCDNDLCWCSIPKTGEINGTIVPQQLMTTLPCYNSKLIGAQYLRKCESEAIALQQLQHELNIHGTNNILLNIPRCDADGSYSNFQFVNTGSYVCTWKDNSRISFYQQSIDVGGSNLNCNCARDYTKFQMDGLQTMLVCSSNGDYKPLQEVDEKYFCVDSDGYPVSEILHSGDFDPQQINCTNWIYEMNNFTYSSNNKFQLNI